MNRAPTMEDRSEKLGFEEFTVRLQEAGWIGSDGDIVLKNFKVQYKGNDELGNNYIEWKAIERP